ncbi:MAG: hypothetical protein HeimC3_16640 [Candidatus Heimdallarchaeota archaeon LC_3]|nr:MAG: hypothetical protein HeimC3_16640 [Candidatus Heimdallarchaeota archaeon LC_3]
MKSLKNKRNVLIPIVLVASLFLVVTASTNVSLAGDGPDGTYPDSVRISPEGDVPDGSYPDSIIVTPEGDVPDGSYPD